MLALKTNITMGIDVGRADAASIIQEALKRELALFESRERLTLSDIADLEHKYVMTSDDFQKKFEEGALGDDQDYFVWWGLLSGLKAIKIKKDKIKRMIIS